LARHGPLVNLNELTEIELITNDIILATIEHKVPESPKSDKYPKGVELIKVFLDMDLSILGQDEETYINYCQRVRMEY